MCIVFFALNYTARRSCKCGCDKICYPLVVAFNRDESVWRESTAIAEHEVTAKDGSK